MATEKRLIYMEDVRNALYDADAITMKGVAIINQFPTVDAVEVMHGRWIDIYDGIYANPIYKCSVCGNSAPIEERYPVIGRMYTDWSFTNYCPNCGADMRGSEE